MIFGFRYQLKFQEPTLLKSPQKLAKSADLRTIYLSSAQAAFVMKTISPIHAAFLGALLATSINAAAACSAHTDCTSGQYCYDAGFYDNGIWSGVGVCSDYPSNCCSGVDADPIDQNTCACPAASACSECFDLFDESGYIPAFDIYEGPQGTNFACLKTTAMLDGPPELLYSGEGNVMSGIFTVADGNTIDATSYSSVAAFTADATAKAVPGSICSYTDFVSSNTCVRTVSNLDPTVTYVYGAVNKDETGAKVARLGITTCTSAASFAKPFVVLYAISALVSLFV